MRSVEANSPWARDFGYVRAIKCGPLVEVGGTTALAPDGKPQAPGDYYRQTGRCLEIIEASLLELGIDRNSVLRTRFFLRQVSGWREAGRAHREFFGDHLPTSSAVGGVDLLMPELVVEIEVTAWSDDG